MCCCKYSHLEVLDAVAMLRGERESMKSADVDHRSTSGSCWSGEYDVCLLHEMRSVTAHESKK
jgi:hypothetical protein